MSWLIKHISTQTYVRAPNRASHIGHKEWQLVSFQDNPSDFDDKIAAKAQLNMCGKAHFEMVRTYDEAKILLDSWKEDYD